MTARTTSTPAGLWRRALLASPCNALDSSASGPLPSASSARSRLPACPTSPYPSPRTTTRGRRLNFTPKVMPSQVGLVVSTLTVSLTSRAFPQLGSATQPPLDERPRLVVTT